MSIFDWLIKINKQKNNTYIPSNLKVKIRRYRPSSAIALSEYKDQVPVGCY